jgi:hypothetical protein
MPRTLTWPPTASTSSSSMDSLRAASSIMFPERTTTKQTGYPRSAPLASHPSQGIAGDNLQALHQAVARVQLHLRARGSSPS